MGNSHFCVEHSQGIIGTDQHSHQADEGQNFQPQQQAVAYPLSFSPRRCNTRRLGRIRLRDDPRQEPPIGELGFDPLHDLPTAGWLADKLGQRKAPIKAVLLDQSFAAGVGNWIADEVLYQARIDPSARANTLTLPDVRRLRGRLKHVIETAVEVDGLSARFPKRWLFHHRWGKDSEAVTARGERIEYVTIAGRTTAWVPDVQR